MKLDFLKDGLINTANFIPAYAIGEINTNPVVLTVNILGRILALYLCFQYNSDLEPKSLVIALLFPTLYIIYIIAVKGIDSVLEKFDLETKDFTEMFDSDKGKCIERKGLEGDMKSVPKDKETCENIEGNLYNSKILCESVSESEDTNSTRKKKREDAGVCKYVSNNADTRRCRDFEYQENCTGSGFGCEWKDYADYSSNEKRQICSQSVSNNLQDCPDICPYYQAGNVSFNVIQGSGGMNAISLAKGFIPQSISEATPGPLLKITESGSTGTYNQRRWKFSVSGEETSFINIGSTTENDADVGEDPQSVYGSGSITRDGSRWPSGGNDLYIPSTAITETEDQYLVNGFPKKKPASDSSFDNELIVVGFNAADDENTFRPLMSTDYRGKSVQIRVTANDDNKTTKVISGVVRLIVTENEISSSSGVITNYGDNNIYGQARLISSGSRKEGKYALIIQPRYSSLKNFYDDIDLTTTPRTDTIHKKLIFAEKIQVVISSDSQSCGELYLNADVDNDPLEGSIRVLGVDETGNEGIYTDTISDLGWSGQKKGMCTNPDE